MYACSVCFHASYTITITSIAQNLLSIYCMPGTILSFSPALSL